MTRPYPKDTAPVATPTSVLAKKPAVKNGAVAVKAAASKLTTVPSAIRGHELTVCFGTNNTDVRPQKVETNVASLIDLLKDPDLKRGKLPLATYLALDKKIPAEKAIRDAEKNGEYLILGEFVQGRRRVAANLVSLTGFMGDIDTGTVTRAELNRVLAGTFFIAYSTYSHQPSVPKWRFVIPYATPIAPDAHQKVYEHYQCLFGGQLDHACSKAGQLWYTPACPPDAGQHYEFFFGDGDLFDPSALPEMAVEQKPSKPQAVSAASRPANVTKAECERIRSALAAFPSDDRDQWIKIGMALKQQVGGEVALELWNQWSAKSTKYDSDDCERTWNSFAEDFSGAGVTLGTIFHHAKEHGWKDDVETMPAEVKAINDTHFMALSGGRSIVFKEEYNSELARNVLTTYAFSEFKNFHANKLVAVPQANGTKNMSAVDLWHRHPARRSFEQVVFLPGKTAPPGTYNTWRGFPYKSMRGDWGLMEQHIRENICNSDAASTEYLLNWMAFALQFPDRLPEVAVVLKGQRGTGKGKLISTFMKLFGEHARQITNSRHLTGNFNAHLRDCVLLFVDEALWAGDKAGENILKALITEQYLQVERKYQDVITALNRLHIMMASNNDWVIPAGDKERRFFVLEVSSARLQNHAYFKAIDDQMDQGGLRAMMFDLMNRDLSSFNVRDFVHTEALDEQVIRTMQPDMMWWIEHLRAGSAAWEYQGREQLARDFASHGGTYKERSSATLLGLFLCKVLKSAFVKVGYTFPHERTPTKCYKFPDLQTCRQMTEVYLGVKSFDWT